MSTLLKYIIPRIRIRDLPMMLVFCLIGSMIAGIYGLIHDQITFSIGPEYFTRLKFKQFQWADLRLGDRWFVGTIGFLATWWVGFLVAWLLTSRLLPYRQSGKTYQKILAGFALVFATVLIAGFCGFVYGIARGPSANYSAWEWAFQRYAVSDRWRFVRVAYIHNAGYIGGAVGLVLTYIFIRPEPPLCPSDS